MSGGIPVPPLPGGVPAPNPPAGGALPAVPLVAKAAVVAVGVAQSLGNDITFTFDSASKDASPRSADGCAACRNQATVENIVVLDYPHLFLPFSFLRLRLKASWEYNGCDVTGATFILGSSIARIMWAAEVTGKNVETAVTSPSLCQDCCPRAACVKLRLTIKVKPPFQATRIFDRIVTTCGNGALDPGVPSGP